MLLCFVGIIICFVFLGCAFNGSNTRSQIAAVGNTIVEALETGNADLLQSVLSKNALATEDLNDGVQYCFDLFEGTSVEVIKLGCPEQDSFNAGIHIKQIDCSFIVKTDAEKTYYLFFILQTQNEQDNGCVGVNYIELQDNEEYLNIESYRRCGIYNPLWATKPA